MTVVILENVRSAYNVGAIARTLDAVGGGELVCCGITPHPEVPGDRRSPVVREANARAIAKTALGAERAVAMSYRETAAAAIADARAAGHTVVCLEQHPAAQDLFALTPPPSGTLALVLGGEVDGVSPPPLAACDAIVAIPQRGVKESLNVSVAAGVALYALARPR